jgi:hypothetical protein
MAAETADERLARLDAETAAELEAERIADADAELARMFGTPDDGEVVTVAPTRDTFKAFRAREAANRAAEAAADAKVEADITADENRDFLHKAAAPATTGLARRASRLDLAIEGADEVQRLKDAQSTDLQN